MDYESDKASYIEEGMKAERIAMAPKFQPHRWEKYFTIYSTRRNYVLEHGTAEEIIALFNSILAVIAYDKYPVTDEYVLRALLQVYLIGKGHDVRVEQHNYKGRSDILVNFQKRRVVIELKYTSRAGEEQKKLKEAENQLRVQDYGHENLGERTDPTCLCI